MTEIQHPDFEDLLRLVDESTPSRSNRWVRKHVAACWKCRSHLEELQETVREFARYHEKVLVPNMPPPPLPWPDLRARMKQVDEANPMPDLWSRAYAYMSLPRALSLKRLMIGGILFTCAVLAVTLALRSGERAAPAAPHSAPIAAPKIAPVAEPEPVTTPAPKRTSATALAVLSPADVEVQIFAALRSIDADLGDPIEISSDSKGKFHRDRSWTFVAAPGRGARSTGLAAGCGRRLFERLLRREARAK